MRLTGPVFAIVTPFTKKGEVCYESLKDYLNFMAHNNVINIVINGTTGEFPSLTLDERMSILEFTRKNFDGIIINHVSSCSSKDSTTLLKHTEDFANAALILPPYYYANVPEEGMFRFILESSQNNPLPLFLYNFPRHTQNQITIGLVERLRNYCNIVGIKDSGGDFSVSLSYKKSIPDLQVFVGNDTVALNVLLHGLDGSVTGACNPIPYYLINLHKSFLCGNIAEAQKYQDKICAWLDFSQDLHTQEISIIKSGLKVHMPKFPLFTRPPLVKASDDISAKIKHQLNT